MRAVVLCPGPSLHKTLARFGGVYGVTIGVNRAALSVKCDWLSSTDWPFLRDFHPLGEPKLFTLRASRDSLRRRDIDWDGLNHEDIGKGHRDGLSCASVTRGLCRNRRRRIGRDHDRSS